MITIISGTNRANSKTAIVAKGFAKILEQRNIDAHLVDLNTVSIDIPHADIYNADKLPTALAELQDKFIIPADKFLVVAPEYNGSIPGYFKFFLDTISVRHYEESFKGKKVACVGVSAGRAGNLRGTDHLASIFNHIGSIVMPGSLPLSSIDGLLNEDETLKDDTLSSMETFAQKFNEF